jgi:hypothetical protein
MGNDCRIDVHTLSSLLFHHLAEITSSAVKARAKLILVPGITAPKLHTRFPPWGSSNYAASAEFHFLETFL